MINEALRQRVEGYWARELGCSLEELCTPGVKVRVRVKPGTFLFGYGESGVWHVPAGFVDAARREVEGRRDLQAVFQSDVIERVFGSAIKLVLGPCPLGYCDAVTVRRDVSWPTCRLLGAKDATAIAQLRAVCGNEAWKHGGVNPETQRAVFGCFAEEQLVAAASYEQWSEVIAHVGLVTSPAFRGQGFGKAVGRAAAEYALQMGFVPQWRTLASNAASVAVGKAIGFEEIARH